MKIIKGKLEVYCDGSYYTNTSLISGKSLFCEIKNSIFVIKFAHDGSNYYSCINYLKTNNIDYTLVGAN